METITSTLFSFPLILLYSALFGATMKLADCFNEHGFKWFMGDAILFGIFFGLFGGILIGASPILTNLYLSLLLVNILRFRVDCLNHGIAAVLMFLSFLMFMGDFAWSPFLFFFLTFAIFGLAMDVVLPKLKNVSRLFYNFFELRLFYLIVTFLFSLFTGEWIAFVSMSFFQISYDTTSYLVKRSPRYVKDGG